MTIVSSSSYELIASKIALECLEPYSNQIDSEDVFAYACMQELARSGLLGTLVPSKYGGLGGSISDFTTVTEILAQSCASVAAVFLFHGQVIRRVEQFGSEEQKKYILPRLASGTWIGASSWSELTAGADKKGLKTVAKLSGDSLVLNGRKAFCTGAGEADIYTVLVRTGREAERELSFIIIYKTDTGVSFGDLWGGMGMRGSSTKEIVCEQCILPTERLLGEIGDGGKIMSHNRSQAIHSGIIGLGIAKAALRVAQEYLAHKPRLWEFQNTRMVLSELLIQTHALELMIFHAANLADKGNGNAAQASMEAKVMSANVCKTVVDSVMQLCGAQGYVRGQKIERLYRDAKAIGIMGPTTELSKEYIASDWWANLSGENNGY